MSAGKSSKAIRVALNNGIPAAIQGPKRAWGPKGHKLSMAVNDLTEAKRVCDYAEDKGVLVVPHCWKSAIGIAASAHLSATTLSCPYIEFLPKELAESQLRKDLVLEELPLENGKILLPTKPGLGIKVDEEKLKKYSV